MHTTTVVYHLVCKYDARDVIQMRRVTGNTVVTHAATLAWDICILVVNPTGTCGCTSARLRRSVRANLARLLSKYRIHRNMQDLSSTKFEHVSRVSRGYLIPGKGNLTRDKRLLTLELSMSFWHYYFIFFLLFYFLLFFLCLFYKCVNVIKVIVVAIKHRSQSNTRKIFDYDWPIFATTQSLIIILKKKL